MSFTPAGFRSDVSKAARHESTASLTSVSMVVPKRSKRPVSPTARTQGDRDDVEKYDATGRKLTGTGLPHEADCVSMSDLKRAKLPLQRTARVMMEPNIVPR